MSSSNPRGPGYPELRPMTPAPDQKPAKGKDHSPSVVLAIGVTAILLAIVGFLVYMFIALSALAAM